MKVIYQFDGSYNGFLTALFESFERKHFDVQIEEEGKSSGDLFSETFEIFTDLNKSKRVLSSLKKKVNSTKLLDLFKVFLSENTDAQNALFYILQELFKGNKTILSNFGDPRVLLFDKTLTKVNRERHRMKAFIRFEKSSDELYYCLIEPDFNVLPLILTFFKNRYADQKWLIYDLKRNYGMMHEKGNLIEVQLSKAQSKDLTTTSDELTLDENEEKYQRLWKQYFKSTNIEARKNMKLHLQHVPRRYWKYLTEKQ